MCIAVTLEVSSRLRVPAGVGSCPCLPAPTCSWPAVPLVRPGVRGLAVEWGFRLSLAPRRSCTRDAHLQLAGVLLVLQAGRRGRAGHPPSCPGQAEPRISPSTHRAWGLQHSPPREPKQGGSGQPPPTATLGCPQDRTPTLSASSGTRCCTRSSTYMLGCSHMLRRTQLGGARISSSTQRPGAPPRCSGNQIRPPSYPVRPKAQGPQGVPRAGSTRQTPRVS